MQLQTALTIDIQVTRQLIGPSFTVCPNGTSYPTSTRKDWGSIYLARPIFAVQCLSCLWAESG